MGHRQILIAAIAALLPWQQASAQFPTPVATAAPADPGAIPLYPDTSGASAATERWVRFGNDLAVNKW